MRISHRRVMLVALTCLVPWWIGCNQTNVQTPTRSLDRPSDVALVCAVPTDDRGTLMMPLDACNGDDDGSGFPIGDGGVIPGQLFALAANTARGEVALVTAGETNLGPITGYAGDGTPIRKFVTGGATIINLDLSQPGYGFLPVGSMPQHIRTSRDSCIAVTANLDSCDLAVIDVQRLIRVQTTETEPTSFIASVVRRLQPRLPGGGAFLAARPAWIEFTAAPGIVAGEFCTHLTGYRAYVAFPTCQLVAEIDLTSGELLQALRVTRSGAVPLDPATVSCPVECAGVGLDAAVPPRPDAAASEDAAATDDAAAADDAAVLDDAATLTEDAAEAAAVDGGADGGLPSRLPTTQAMPTTLALDTESSRLFVGDATGEAITAVSLDEAGRFAAVSRLPLASSPGGVEVLRLSPRLADPDVTDDPGVRYLYAIARDRTVRVIDIDRNLECETNPEGHALQQSHPIVDDKGDVIADPLAVQRALRCLPVGDPATPPRSPLATSPGITLPGHSLPRDVGFVHVIAPEPVTSGTALLASSALTVGDFAWIVDSAGRSNAINLYDRCPQPNDPKLGDDPTQACHPSAFAPSVAEAMANPGTPVPLAIDLMPNRLRNGNDRFLSVAQSDTTGAPRLADLPMVVDDSGSLDPFSADHAMICNPPSLDDGDAVGCTNPPARIGDPTTHLVQFRDPSLVQNETWTLTWEGTIPGTSRASGAVYGATLTDFGAAFCSRGVETGDKLVLVGCGEDADCGLDQECYHDPGAPDASRGLCLNRSASLLEQAKSACTPWTRASRRYLVVEATATQLTLDELAEPEHIDNSHPCVSDADCQDVTIPATIDSLPGSLPTSCLDDGRGARRCLRACTPGALGPPGMCGRGYLCTRSRVGDDRCLRAPLPPTDPAVRSLCFPELQIYAIQAGESFFVDGDVSGVLTGGMSDPESGRCSSATDDSARLLWPRIPLDAPACPEEINTGNWWGPLPSGIPNACRLSLPDSPNTFVRFANPLFDLVVAVPEIRHTGTTADGGTTAASASPQETELQRAPSEGTIVTFTVVGGFHALNFTLGIDITAQLPRVAVVGPDRRRIYIVDEGKQNAASGLRGQIIRFLADTLVSDSTFDIK